MTWSSPRESPPQSAAADGEPGPTNAAARPLQASGEPDPRADEFADRNTADQRTSATTSPAGEFTIAFAGDVNFADRTADRLAADPETAFGVAAPGLAAADLTMVNLETAITTGGEPEPKSFTFRAPPTALTALADAGIDVASMANNHGADYGATGLARHRGGDQGFGIPGDRHRRQRDPGDGAVPHHDQRRPAGHLRGHRRA